MLLTDDLSASAADLFAAIIQDTWRGPIFGWRTMGLGGSVGYFENATTYSEGFASVTWTQLTREHPASKPGYPTTAYIENVGVHPDIEYDSQTRENLLNRYGPYVDAFTNAMLNHIAVSQ
jgi:C-terminal processing protease CtpA/Prc